MTWQQLAGAEVQSRPSRAPPPRWMLTEMVFSHRGSWRTPFFKVLRWPWAAALQRPAAAVLQWSRDDGVRGGAVVVVVALGRVVVVAESRLPVEQMHILQDDFSWVFTLWP